MPKKNSDKKIARYSTRTELIVNIGTITSWLLSIISAITLNIQKFPIVIPGTNITLSAGFQFALVISGLLAFLQYLLNYWIENPHSLNLSKSFIDFLFLDLLHFKRPILLIPFVITLPVIFQVAADSFILQFIITIMFILLVSIGIYRAYQSKEISWQEEIIERLSNNEELLQRWIERIHQKLYKAGRVTTSDFFDSGYRDNDKGRFEIDSALEYYFQLFELSEGLSMVRRKQISAKEGVMYDYFWDLTLGPSEKNEDDEES